MLKGKTRRGAAKAKAALDRAKMSFVKKQRGSKIRKQREAKLDVSTRQLVEREFVSRHRVRNTRQFQIAE